MQSVFSNVWNIHHGFTPEEAEEKAKRVNAEHGVYEPGSKWKPAKLVPDPHRKTGYMVVIETIS